MLVTHLGDLSYKVTTSSVIFVSYLGITSKITIILLDLPSLLYNQPHSLIRYHFKSIHSTPQLKSVSICSICMRYWQIPTFSVLFHIYPNYNPSTNPCILTSGQLIYPTLVTKIIWYNLVLLGLINQSQTNQPSHDVFLMLFSNQYHPNLNVCICNS